MKTFKAMVDGKETEFLVKMPESDDIREADKVHNRTFKDALESGAILKIKLDKVLRDQGIWDDYREIRVKTIQKEISNLEQTLFLKGKIKLSEAKKLALTMKDKREELREILSEKTGLESMTAEAQADNARFNFLISRCVVYNDTKKHYFKNYADYINQGGSEVAQKAASTLVTLLVGLGDYESELPENKFLKKWGFVDDKFRLVNKDNKLVDREGRLIDENGRYIDENGKYVDKDGNPVDEEGNYHNEELVFYDDDGIGILDPDKKIDTPIGNIPPEEIEGGRPIVDKIEPNTSPANE